MKYYEKIYTVKSWFGRIFDPSPEMNDADYDLWSKFPELFTEKEYFFRDKKIVLNFDWQTIANKNEGELICTAKLPIEWKQDDLKLGSRGDDYLYHSLYEAFIIINLSSPGAFNLFNAIVKSNTHDKHTTFVAASYLFEMAWHESIEKKWPVVEYIPVEKVYNWYNFLNIGTKQLAKEKVEKVLFSLLHLAQLENMDPLSVMWLAHCLEGIYDTPPVLSRKYLVERIQRLLASPKNKTKILKRIIREFYEARDSFAHGGAPVSHPLGNELFDRSVEHYKYKLLNLISFIATIIISTIQHYIKNNIKAINYLEREEKIEIRQ